MHAIKMTSNKFLKKYMKNIFLNIVAHFQKYEFDSKIVGQFGPPFLGKKRKIIIFYLINTKVSVNFNIFWGQYNNRIHLFLRQR